MFACVNSLSDNSLISTLDYKSHPYTSSYEVISPRDNLFISASDKSRVMQPLPALGANRLLDRFMNGYEGSGIETGFSGEEILSSAKQIPSTGWFIIGSVPTAAVFERITHIRNEAIQMASVVSLFVTGFLWFFLRYQLSPLSRSADLIGMLSVGKTAPMRSIPVEGSPEIRQLQSSFNQLQKNLAHDEKLLREDEALYHSMFTDNTAIKLLIDPKTMRIVDANPAAADFTDGRWRNCARSLLPKSIHCLRN